MPNPSRREEISIPKRHQLRGERVFLHSWRGGESRQYEHLKGHVVSVVDEERRRILLHPNLLVYSGVSTPGFRFMIRSQFLVSGKNGFLPREWPLVCLPKRYDELETMLKEMPVKREDGQAGLLASGQFGERVHKFTNYVSLVKEERDSRLLHGLLRDYSFAASAYLLEPCHLHIQKYGDSYGLGRNVLPAQLAEPLWLLAQRLKAKPFLEYAHGYALMNFKVDNCEGMVDPRKCHDWSDIQLVRQFEGGESESGFVAIHVAMVSHTASLVKAVKDCLRRNHAGLADLLSCMRRINETMELMWQASKPSDYISFRTFIMGIKDQPMFPDGVIYEGVSAQPQVYRGESGANDSIIPTMDNLLELTPLMPENPLTRILMDFRRYRPLAHTRWLSRVAERSVGIRGWLLQHHARELLLLLDQVREFRWRHWQFTCRYILAHTKHPVATGGSPILTWLPNQLRTVLMVMREVLLVVPDADISAIVEAQLAELRH